MSQTFFKTFKRCAVGFTAIAFLTLLGYKGNTTLSVGEKGNIVEKGNRSLNVGEKGNLPVCEKGNITVEEKGNITVMLDEKGNLI